MEDSESVRGKEFGRLIMKISLRKISLVSVLSVLPLVLLVRANSGAAGNQPAQASESVTTFAGNAQHTANYQPAAQPLNRIQWSTTNDLNPGDFAHYGSPLVTAGNTVIVPVKTATDGFRIDAIDGANGAPKYTLTTDYVLPTHVWIPSYNPVVATGSFGTRLYYPGRGGTIYYIDNPDSAAHGAPVHQVFYTTLANYQSNAAAYDAAIFINTPITADSQGNIFFGFRVQGTAPAPIASNQSGFARIDSNGNGSFVLIGTAANDTAVRRVSHNSAPALSNDETTLYVLGKSNTTGAYAYLLGLDSTTLATKYRLFLTDPRNGDGAVVADDATSSPMVAPDDDVYIGVLGNPGNGSRGFLMRYSADLTVTKTPGGFGWDYTAAIVPASMVPSYQGTSSYLIFSKYNNYNFEDGDGVNRIAILDPNATQIDPHVTAENLVEMREVLTVTGPTPDENALGPDYPYAVREWCINTAAVNPATNSIYLPSEDGHIYSWNLATNSLSQGVQLNQGIGQPYVPTVVGPNGVIYTLNGGTFFALGGYTGVGIAVASSMPDVRSVAVGQSLTFTATITNTGATGGVPTGTVTFQDFTYNNLTPVTTTLASNVPLNGSGVATVTTSALTAGGGFLGNHHISAIYSGDGTFSGGTATLIQKVHASASTTTLTSSPNPSNGGQSVTFTATVGPVPPGSGIPSGMVTFQEGPTVLAQRPLNSAGSASFTISNLTGGDHTITAVYASDTVFAASSGTRLQTVVGGASPTPAVTPTPGTTPTPSPGITPTPTPPGTPSPTPGVTPPPTSQALNLSTRMRVETGANVGIGGFIITGSAPKHVLLRAIGPSSTSVSGVLADPVLELRGPSIATVTNDNWQDDPAQAAAIIATGIQPTNNLESAIDATLNPGAYTAIVSGKNGTTGVALVEVYDLSPAVLAKLANISTRALVGTGSDIVIAGFILGNNSGLDQIIIRGIGPSLTSLGVAGALANPTLELRDSNGAVVISNNDWQDDPVQAGLLTAAGLAPGNALESGLAIALSPGAYTALLGGQNNTTGVGLVEVYDRGTP